MNIKLIIGFGVTFVSGMAAGAVASGLYFKKQTTEAIESFREMYNEHLKDIDDAKIDAMYAEFDDEDAENDISEREKLDINRNKPEIEKFKRGANRVDYNSIKPVNGAKNGLNEANIDPRPPIDIHDDDEEEENEADFGSYNGKIGNMSIDILHDSSVFDENNGYEKVEATYYAENEIVLNDADDYVIDISKWPFDVKEEFEDDKLWVHDGFTGTDYEISYDEGSYYIEN